MKSLLHYIATPFPTCTEYELCDNVRQMCKVELVYFEAGGGHRSALEALELVISQQRQWQVGALNLQESLDSIDVARKLTGVRLQDVYNLMLRRNWTWAIRQLLVILHAVIRLYHDDEVRLLERLWRQDPPHLVVSLIPHFNRALFEAARRAAPAAPFVTILTDFADHPPHFWMEPQDQFFVCGTDRAVEQARALGVAGNRIYRASGMIVHPRFYEPIAVDRGAERQRLGLDPDLPTGLVLFGGYGSSSMMEIARRLDRSQLELQLILICGRNQRLEQALRSTPGRLRRCVVGYTTEMPYYMQLADFFIGKPGPGSLSEALLMKLPVIVERNARTLAQERYNTEWILEKQVGIVVRSFRQIDGAVEELLRPANLARYRANAAAVQIRAVFEMVGILESILLGRSPGERCNPHESAPPQTDAPARARRVL